jgi:ABC-2 type transport system ATP-binding protein
MAIQVENVSKFYGAHQALKSISFQVEKGTVLGVLGPNGAGKSTLLKILSGYLSGEGTVVICGEQRTEENIEIKKKIGYLPEHNPLYKEMFVREYLRFVGNIHKIAKKDVEKTLIKVGLLPESNKKIKELSKGYQQRVGLAAAILHDPEIIILDEPTTGLDPNQLVEIRSLIAELGKDKIVLFSSHILQEVEAVCNRVLIVKEGQIVADENLETLNESQTQVIEVSFESSVEKKYLEALENTILVKKRGETSWELTFDTTVDMRSKVFDFANENGLKIVQLLAKNKNLEALFTELTMS